MPGEILLLVVIGIETESVLQSAPFHLIHQQVKQMLIRQANASTLGIRAEDIVNAVKKALSHHAQIHRCFPGALLCPPTHVVGCSEGPPLFTSHPPPNAIPSLSPSTKLFKKPSWPFSEPHKDALPKENDTLAEAFIKILRMYLTPYNFAPIGNTQPWRSSSASRSPGNRSRQPEPTQEHRQSNVSHTGGMVGFPTERTPLMNVAADQAGAHHSFDSPEPRHAAESSSSRPSSPLLNPWTHGGASAEHQQQQQQNRRPRVQSDARLRAREENWEQRF